MKIELKAVKIAKFASRETTCFEAAVHVDGKKAGYVSNDGNGGCHRYEPHAVHDVLLAQARTYPAGSFDVDLHGKIYSVDPTADALVDRLLGEGELLKDMRRAMKERFVFTIAGRTGVFQSAKIPAANMARFLADPERLKAKLRADLTADKILNLLPEAEAFAIYGAQAA